jgi:hypothetical protein
MAAAFDVTVVSRIAETRERSPLELAPTRAVGHAPTLAENRKISAFLSREADIQELPRMNDDAPRERSFQFRPFAEEIIGAYGVGATDIFR